MIKTAILDVDGTLIDSNEAHAQSWAEAFHRVNLTIPYSDIRRAIGMGGDHLLPALSQIPKDTSLGQTISRYRAEIFQSKLPFLRAFPRTRELLEKLKSHNCRLIVATSASQDDLQGLLQTAQLNDLINDAVTADDADRSKPDPDIVQAALRKAKTPPDQALMLGDTPYDIEAARKAAVRTIAFTCGGWDAESLKGAIRVYRDPADLMEQFDASPFRTF